MYAYTLDAKIVQVELDYVNNKEGKLHIDAKRRGRGDSDVSTVQIMVMLHLRVGRTLYVIPKRVSRELEGPKIYCLLSKR